VVYSWNQREIDRFEATLSPDFTFYFNPNDVGQNPSGNYVIPESWGYDEMTAAVGNMLVEAYNIDFDIVLDNVGTPPAGATVYVVEDVNISLLVRATTEYGYFVDGGYCNFEFEKYRANDGRDYWRLRKWWDFTTGAGALDGGMPTTLGKILTLFR